jgi:hypothetical protein
MVYYREDLLASAAKFKFERDNCTVDDLVKAFVAAFPGRTSTRDPRTGILWIYPQAMAYDQFLGGKVKLRRDLVDVPMLTGIWQKLIPLRPSELTTIFTKKEGTLNTYDCPVSLPSGIYSIRDLINQCCVALPHMGFRVVLSHTGSLPVVEPEVAGLSWLAGKFGVVDPTPGASVYWQCIAGPGATNGLTRSDLAADLSSTNATLRADARNYLAVFMRADPDGWVQQAPPGETAAWIAVALLRKHVCTYGPVFAPGVERLEESVAGDRLKDNPALRVVAAMEIARVTKRTSFFDEAMKVPLSAAEVANVKEDMIRNLHYSEVLRTKMMELNPGWPGFSRADIAAMEDTDYFSRP